MLIDQIHLANAVLCHNFLLTFLQLLFSDSHNNFVFFLTRFSALIHDCSECRGCFKAIISLKFNQNSQAPDATTLPANVTRYFPAYK